MKTKIVLGLLIVFMALSFVPMGWNGADSVPYAYGMVVIDAYDGMITIPLFDVYYCPSSANCAKY